MRIFRLLALSLLISAFTTHGKAQSSAPPPSTVHGSPYRFPLYGQLPQLFGQSAAQPPANRFKLPRSLHNTFLLPQNTLVASLDDAPLIAKIVAPRRPNAICYTMRSYTVAPDSPGSDSTHLTGSTTCLPAANVQAKTIVDPGNIYPPIMAPR